MPVMGWRFVEYMFFFWSSQRPIEHGLGPWPLDAGSGLRKPRVNRRVNGAVHTSGRGSLG